jgi:hypothetical protein
MTTNIGNSPANLRPAALPPLGEVVQNPELPSAYTLKTTRETFSDSVVRDWNSGVLKPETKELVEAVLSAGKSSPHKVRVNTFAVEGIQANDMLVIQRTPPTPNGPNIVLFMPEKDGPSFHGFKDVEGMNAGLKELAANPERLERFARHFPGHLSNRIKEVMSRFKDNDINAMVGLYGYEGSDIFSRLDKTTTTPPAPVNGLADLQGERESAEGRPIYSGKRPDGEKVIYEYDAYGNLLGAGNKGNYYFVKNGLNNHDALLPLSSEQFKIKVATETFTNVHSDDVSGFYAEFIHHLENPFYGMGEALQAFGVSKDTANTVERYMDNPVSAALIDLNKDNQIGKVFGVDKPTMDAELKGAGDFVQGFVPYYGQARMLGSTLAKALKNEPLSDDEKRDLADALVLKPDSLARKNLPSPESKPKPTQLPSNREKPFGVEGPEQTPQVPPAPVTVDEKGVWVAGPKRVEEVTLDGGKLIRLGGTMENLNEVGDGIYTFVDVNKKGKEVRLNIMAHGEEPGTTLFTTDTKTPTKIFYDGKAHTPQELLETLKAKGINPADYDNVRLLMCYSGNGKEASFAAEFSRLIGRPVKGYEGTLSAYVSPEVVKHLATNVETKVAEVLGGENNLLPVEAQAVHDVATRYVQGKFATKAFEIAKKNPHFNPIQAWFFTYKPVTFNSVS